MYRSVVRPLLFQLAPDRSHHLAQLSLRWELPWKALGRLANLELDDPRLRTTYAGIGLPNPIGLAAGFDKDADLLPALSWLGFGFLVAGSVMPERRFGNPFPRLARYPDTESLSNSMGVPSKGHAHAVGQFRRFTAHRQPVFANVSGFSADEIARVFYAVEPHVEGMEISLMCPNVAHGGEAFDEMALLDRVLLRIENRSKPVTIGVPGQTLRNPGRLAEMIDRCIDAGVDGLKISTAQRINEPRLGTGEGTLSGRATFGDALANVRLAAQHANGRIAIAGNGGVSNGAEAFSMLEAGASRVDLFSAFIYEGWTIARKINLELLEILNRKGISSVREIGAGSESGSSARNQIAAAFV